MQHTVKEPKWTSAKLKQTTILTLATALKSVNLINKQLDENLNKDVIKTITAELRSCADTECSIAVLHALGNAAALRFTINTLEKTALDFQHRREAIAAMKAIRDSLENKEVRRNDSCNFRLIIVCLTVTGAA